MIQTPHIGRVKAAAIAFALGLPAAAFAGDGPYVGLEGGANWEANQNIRNGDNTSTGDSTKFKTGWLAGGVAGYSFANGLRPELEVDFRRNQFRKLNNNVAGTSETDVNGFEDNLTGMANIWYDLKTSSGFFSVVHPYIGGGVGISRFDVDKFSVGGVEGVNGFDTVFAYQGGAGVGYDITRHLTASIDWRYLETTKGKFNVEGTDTTIDAKYRSNSLMGGLRYSFGGDKPAPVAYTPPPPAYVPPPPPPGPCSDRDGDGVCDAVDKCPGTPKGFKVDADGCIIEQKIILRSVNFEFNKATLTAPAMSSLDEVGAALVGQPSLRVEIAGYTDSIGKPGYNLALSKKRAASVKSYLVSKGVPASNLVSQGYGEKSPVATNDTEEGRTENRRVEFSVLNKPANADVITKGSTDASKSAADGDPVAKRSMKKSKKKHVSQ
jgi:OOP family OmpA-OmpF porin